MREVLDAPDKVWAPRAGEPVIARVRTAEEADAASEVPCAAGVA